MTHCHCQPGYWFAIACAQRVDVGARGRSESEEGLAANTKVEIAALQKAAKDAVRKRNLAN